MIAIPLQITKKGFLRTDVIDKSISSALSMLLQTPCYSCVADPLYGFVLKNLRFEVFNENEGTVDNFQTDITSKDQLLYKMKVSGSSKNVSTFAAELKEAVTKYEPRLSDVSTMMTYIREEKKIYITVKGVITETGEAYQYQTILKIWN